MSDGPVVVVLGHCFGCGRSFTFNPHHVPSYRTDPADPSSREPICESCIAIANERRREAGLEEWAIHPDAYEPITPAEL